MRAAGVWGFSSTPVTTIRSVGPYLAGHDRIATDGDNVAISLHHGDLPENIDFGTTVAIDTETMGLDVHRDRLCLVQLSGGDGNAHLVKFSESAFETPRLNALLTDPDVLKIFHFGRFDIAVIRRYLGVTTGPVYCTKIASKLVRTYTDRHGLKDLCRELLSIDLSKEQQSTDWGAAELTERQIDYAASDVLHLHALKQRLDKMLEREDRIELAQACFNYLCHRAELDLAGWSQVDIFAH